MQPVESAFDTLIEDVRFKPCSRIKVFPTSKTVPSLGFKVAFYNVSKNDDMITGDWWDEAGVSLVYPDSSSLINNIIEPSSTLAFDWGVGGSPPPLSKSYLTAIRWHGFFFARYSGVYRFFLNCPTQARLRIEFNNTYLTLKDSKDDSTVSNWTDTNVTDGIKREVYANTSSLTTGNWYQIQIEFWTPDVHTPLTEPNFLSVLYREPDATTNYNEWGNSGGNIVTDYQSDYLIAKPLSAGVVNCTQSDGTRTSVTTGNVSFLSGDILAQVTTINGQRSKDEASEYTFDVPIPNATSLASDVSTGDTSITIVSSTGFPSSGVGDIEGDKFTYTGKTPTSLTGIPPTGSMALVTHSTYDPVSISGAGDYPYNPITHSFGVIKAMRLCTIELGYQSYADTPVSYYQYRMWGFIYPNPIVQRSMDGTDIMTVTVRDIRLLLTVDYNKNYPDFASYSVARYYNDNYLAEPDGIDRPVAYDRWSVQKAVRDILIKANIDPVLLYGKRRKNINGGANYNNDYGNYLIFSQSQLDANPQYGHPMAIDNDADDLYNWFFGYGEYFADGLSEIAQNFLYHINVQPDGKFVFQPINIPSQVYNDDGSDDDGIAISSTTFEVTAPNTIVELSAGTNYSITWDSDSAGSIKIELYRQGYNKVANRYNGKYRADPVYGIVISSTADDGSYSWTIPAAITMTDIDGNDYRFKIKITDLSDTTKYDFSDTYFTIVEGA